MCGRYARKGACGHQISRATWEPEDPRDCPEAVQANRRDRRTNKLLRCSPPQSTYLYSVHDRVCERPECRIQFEIVNRGWTCHFCRCYNQPGVRPCDGRMVGTDVICGHEPCLACRSGHAWGAR
ncbi:uncharacterized protein VDAG_09216 [Verticillium dahliae VdLs.17]|uniref:Uncharacterized protein n=1 Tax=Verticillium dahliae (strain VdLs.17 / ATCC MYA-4575 / FGSC 10137) TaxID=498257 RepID=G2XFU2_VERDV|nr:uncharacterized protein VDAG_09216 [Verticillium dahliae VdLs.17]EGY18690.1 hypothetical protein VDAG_09216 [Verticillium dahliae VdLs.17]KAH6708561.1 hypothetical protein EV126DRAFT_409339 [Verticillium dahliae]